MKRSDLLLALLLLTLGTPAQTTKSGGITAANAACNSDNCVSFNLDKDTATVSVQVTGTWSATLKPEKTVDGSTWVSAGSDITASGVTSFNVPAHTGFRIRASAYVSGVAVVLLKQSSAILASSGGGLADPGGNGVVVRTALDTTVNRTITGTANEITVTDGDGVAGNPTLSLAVGGAVRMQLPGGITFSCDGWPSDCYYNLNDWVVAGAANTTTGHGEGGEWLMGGADSGFTGGETGANATPGHPGTRRLIAGQTTPTAGEQAELQWTAASGSMTWDSTFFVVDVHEWESVCTLGDVRYPLSQDAGSDPPANGIYFEKLSADTNIFFVVRAASSQDRFDTGIACTDSRYLTTHIKRTNSTTVAYAACLWADDTTPCTLPATRTVCASGCDDTSANVPSGSTEARGTYFVQTQTTAAKQIKLDFHFVGITGLSR